MSIPDYVFDETNIRTARDAATIKKAERLLAAVSDENRQTSIRWLQAQNFCAVPVEANTPFYSETIEALIKAMQFAQCREVFAIYSGNLEYAEKCFRVTASEYGLRAFNFVAGCKSYFVLPKNLSFVVECNYTGCYNLICGTRSFVEAFAGKRLHLARDEFYSIATRRPEYLDDEVIITQLSVYKKYRKFI